MTQDRFEDLENTGNQCCRRLSRGQCVGQISQVYRKTLDTREEDELPEDSPEAECLGPFLLAIVSLFFALWAPA